MGLLDTFGPTSVGAAFGLGVEAWSKKLRFEPLGRRPYMYPLMAGIYAFVFAQSCKYLEVFKDQTAHQVIVQDKLARKYQGELLYIRLPRYAVLCRCLVEVKACTPAVASQCTLLRFYFLSRTPLGSRSAGEAEAAGLGSEQ